MWVWGGGVSVDEDVLEIVIKTSVPVSKTMLTNATSKAIRSLPRFIWEALILSPNAAMSVSGLNPKLLPLPVYKINRAAEGVAPLQSR